MQHDYGKGNTGSVFVEGVKHAGSGDLARWVDKLKFNNSIELKNRIYMGGAGLAMSLPAF